MKYNTKGPKELAYDYTVEVYETVFKPIVEDKYGMFNILVIKKLLAGMHEYINAIGKHDINDVINEIKNDYGV